MADKSDAFQLLAASSALEYPYNKPSDMNDLRVLIISHGHPDLSIGGGEIAAYAQFKEFQRLGVATMFVARSGYATGHEGTVISNRSPDGCEVLFNSPPVEHFRHSQSVKSVVYKEFGSLLARFKPTVVHFHHYVHLGLEMIREVRKYHAKCLIVMTLHEYLAICNANGQMLKTAGALCSKASPLDCHICFPEISQQDFFMRELFIKSFFNLCDYFVCPSEFLRDRYIEWGLPSNKTIVLENGQPSCHRDAYQESDSSLHLRFLVLGQLSHLKGTLLLLDAVRLLPRKLSGKISIEIHGTMQQGPDGFKKLFQSGIKGLERIVRYCGPYRTVDVAGIIRSNGWVIQPSIWWENSPLVIQEAFAACRPVICSNVGGMAEKVIDGINGLHFQVGSASDLATRIEEASTRPSLWEKLRKGVPTPPTIHETTEVLIRLYSRHRGLKLSS